MTDMALSAPPSRALSPEEKCSLIEGHIHDILDILGLDTKNPSLAKTPSRVAQMYVNEIFDGLLPDAFPRVTLYPHDNKYDDMIVIKNISFVSFCEHHLLPMVGAAFLAYYPHKHIIGFSAINHIVRYFAHRPQLQERLTTQILESLSSLLQTQDIGIMISAKHFCVIARDSEQKVHETETHCLHGRFQDDASIRSDFFSRLRDPTQSLEHESI